MSEQGMTLAERIDADLKQAMRDRNETTKLTLRALKTAFMQARTSGEEAHELTDAEMLEIVRREAKRRSDAADEYQVLQQYLPQQLSDDEIEVIVRAVIAETGATSVKQMGQVMPAVLALTGALADGKRVNQTVRRLLTQ